MGRIAGNRSAACRTPAEGQRQSACALEGPTTVATRNRPNKSSGTAWASFSQWTRSSSLSAARITAMSVAETGNVRLSSEWVPAAPCALLQVVGRGGGVGLLGEVLQLRFGSDWLRHAQMIHVAHNRLAGAHFFWAGRTLCAEFDPASIGSERGSPESLYGRKKKC